MVHVNFEEALGVTNRTDGVDANDAHSASDGDLTGIFAQTELIVRIGGIERIRGPYGLDEMNVQNGVIGGIHLEEVNPVETGAVQQDRSPGLFVFAEDLAAHVLSYADPMNWSMRRSPVSRLV
jgi:hypothetical protein